MAKISKEPIRLRARKLKSGVTSLYLDCYVNGRRSYEYLKLYLQPGTSPDVKATNKQTLMLAEAIKAKRIVDFQNGKFGFDGHKEEILLLDYYREQCAKRMGSEGSRGNWGNWWSALMHLEKYTKPGTLLCDVDKAFLEGYIQYLRTTATNRDKRKKSVTLYDERKLSKNTIHSYYAKLCAVLNKAHNDGLIERNPTTSVERPKEDETERVYLTTDEVRAMAATPCNIPALKNAFLFSCLTGIRKSDIEKMTWREVVQQGEFTRIIFKQKKTKGQMYLDINEQAVSYMGERRQPDDKVFGGFHYSAYSNLELKKWAFAAGVTKELTFHSARHTFAVMMIDLGADLYVVKELLGHKEIKTTQIYAKVLDKNKQRAVAAIPKLIDEE